MGRIVFVTDVDGTLDYRCTGIANKVIESARDFVSRGGKLALATGRAIVSSKDIAKDLHVNAPSILYGGTMIYDFNKEQQLWTCPLSHGILEIAKEIVITFPDISLLAFSDMGIYILNENEMLWKKGIPQECDHRFCSKEISGNLLKLNFCGEHERIEQLRDTYFTNEIYNFSFSSHHFAEVVSSKAGKGIAIRVLSRLLNIPLQNFVAMGDAQNDMEMLQLAGTSFAVGNATEPLKSVADYILPHCSEEGAAEGFAYAKRLLYPPKNMVNML